MVPDQRGTIHTPRLEVASSDERDLAPGAVGRGAGAIARHGLRRRSRPARRHLTVAIPVEQVVGRPVASKEVGGALLRLRLELGAPPCRAHVVRLAAARAAARVSGLGCGGRSGRAARADARGEVA